MRLKILSWNIWINCDFDKIAEFLASSNADIIGLQEVVPDDPSRDIIGYLTKLGYHHVIAPVLKIEKDGRTMCNAIFSKYSILGSENYVLSETYTRNAVRADIKVGETVFHSFNTHLLHTHQQPSETQNMQIDNLIKILSPERTIVMGDFNATPDSMTVQKMSKAMLNTDPVLTPTLNAELFDCSGCDPQTIFGTQLDYIFTSRDIKTDSFTVYDVKGSDHLPISVVIEA